MKKVLYVFLLLICIFLGMLITDETPGSQSKELQNDIDDFENEIVDPNNGYQNKNNKGVNPNFTNSIGKKGENIIDSVFDFSFNIINSILGN